MNDGPVLSIDRLSVRIESRWIFRGFCLSLNRGEKVTLTGPSGSGKSTVLRCVLGLAPFTDGEIRIDGRGFDERSVWELRRRLAYVAQEPDLGPGTARTALERPFTYRVNAARRDAMARAPELMERFRLSAALLDQDLATLSGGEKQRLALVSALLLDRPILLLDEASAALDAEAKRAVAAHLSGMHDLTVLSVSHDAEWQGFSNRVIDLPGAPEKGAHG